MTEELSDMELEQFTGGKNPNQRKCILSCEAGVAAGCLAQCGTDTKCLESCAAAGSVNCALQCANVSGKRRKKG